MYRWVIQVLSFLTAGMAGSLVTIGRDIDMLVKRKESSICEAVQFKDDPDVLCELNRHIDPLRISYRNPHKPVILIEREAGQDVIHINDWVIMDQGNIHIMDDLQFRHFYDIIQ